MALTTIDICERVRARVIPDAPIALINRIDFAIEMCIPQGLELLAREVAESSEYQILQKDFDAMPAAGVFDLTPLAGILIDSIRRKGAIRLAVGTTPVIFAPRHNAALATTQVDVIHCWLNGTKLLCKGVDGVITTFATALKITANYVPTLAQMPTQKENTLIAHIVELITKKGGVAFLMADPEGGEGGPLSAN